MIEIRGNLNTGRNYPIALSQPFKIYAKSFPVSIKGLGNTACAHALAEEVLRLKTEGMLGPRDVEITFVEYIPGREVWVYPKGANHMQTQGVECVLLLG